MDESLLQLIIGTIISMVILYYVVKDAIISATKDLLKETKIQNDLKIAELRKNGVPEDEIAAIIDQHYKKRK